jgi:nicotinamidase-related amidase
VANAVIVVDMLRGFLEKGNVLYCGQRARAIIPNVQRLLARESRTGSAVIYLVDTHDPGDKEFQMFPPHCLRGTPECQVIPELSPFPGTVVPKSRYSGFFNTALDDTLRALRPGKLVVCGVCTDICVLHTVADARNRDYPVEVYADCVASFDEEAHTFALKHMEKILGARVVSLPPEDCDPPGASRPYS